MNQRHVDREHTQHSKNINRSIELHDNHLRKNHGTNPTSGGHTGYRREKKSC